MGTVMNSQQKTISINLHTMGLYELLLLEKVAHVDDLSETEAHQEEDRDGAQGADTSERGF